MATEWSKVPDEILELAASIIDEHHPELAEFSIGFVFRSPGSFSAGKAVLGQASKITAKFSPFLDLDGLIWLSKDDWVLLNTKQRRALIDHELCHFQPNEEGDQLMIRGHDIEEFREIIERYGLWSPDLHFVAPAFEAIQERLPGFQRNGGVVAVEPAALNVTVEAL